MLPENNLKFKYPNSSLTRTRIDRLTLDEMEKNLLMNHYLQTVNELKRDPKNFTNFKALKKAEYAAFSLADDYAEKFKKGLVTFNDELNAIAGRFVNDADHYETIKKFEADPSSLKNNFLVKSLIQVAEDCVNLGNQLASFRAQTRQNDNFETLKAASSRIEQTTSRTGQLAIQIKDDTAEIKETLAIYSRNLSDVFELIESRKDEIRTNNKPNVQSPNVEIQRRAPETASNDPLPLWTIPRDECEEFFQSNNERGYLCKLCTTATILLPLKEFPEIKKKEFRDVYKFFNPTSDDWQIKFVTHMKALNFKARQTLFKQIGNCNGYGVTNNGFEFYYKLPSSRRMKCYKNWQTNDDCLPTRQVGNYGIPRQCRDFDFVLIVEKTGHQAKFRKLFSDGDVLPVRG